MITKLILVKGERRVLTIRWKIFYNVDLPPISALKMASWRRPSWKDEPHSNDADIMEKNFSDWKEKTNYCKFLPIVKTYIFDELHLKYVLFDFGILVLVNPKLWWSARVARISQVNVQFSQPSKNFLAWVVDKIYCPPYPAGRPENRGANHGT